MVGLPPTMILALGAPALAVPTSVVAVPSNGSIPRPIWTTDEVELDAETFISTLASSGEGSINGCILQGSGCGGHRSAKAVEGFGAARNHLAAHPRFR